MNVWEQMYLCLHTAVVGSTEHVLPIPEVGTAHFWKSKPLTKCSAVAVNAAWLHIYCSWPHQVKLFCGLQEVFLQLHARQHMLVSAHTLQKHGLSIFQLLTCAFGSLQSLCSYQQTHLCLTAADTHGVLES